MIVAVGSMRIYVEFVDISSRWKNSDVTGGVEVKACGETDVGDR